MSTAQVDDFSTTGAGNAITIAQQLLRQRQPLALSINVDDHGDGVALWGATGDAVSVDGGADGTVVPFAQHRRRRCWRLFLAVAFATSLVLALAVLLLAWREHRLHQQDAAAGGAARGGPNRQADGDAGPRRRVHHSLEYFILCVIGGVLSGIPHVMMTPVDIVKCRMQIGEATSVRQGLRSLWAEARQSAAKGNHHHHHAQPHRRSCLMMLDVLFKGWVPTLIGYCLQGALKFGFYEYFKYRFASLFSYETVVAMLVWVFLAASASAELIADVALAPWETVKVRMQTSRAFAQPVPLGEMMPAIWFAEGGARAFFRCLVPLWCRQVPYTMVKFTTFEKCASFISWLLHGRAHQDMDASYGERMMIALLAGYLAGTLCAIVSQPADVVVSRLGSASAEGKQKTLLAVLTEVGWWGLWRGLSARVVLVGALSGAQWAIYDGFKLLSGAASV